MKTNHKVGDRVCVEAGEGAVTEVLTDRNCYRIRLDDGRVQTVDESGVKSAGKKKGEKDEKEPTSPRASDTPARPGEPVHKMTEGPDRSGTRY